MGVVQHVVVPRFFAKWSQLNTARDGPAVVVFNAGTRTIDDQRYTAWRPAD